MLAEQQYHEINYQTERHPEKELKLAVTFLFLAVFIAHGVILSLLSLAGDLTESSLKRAAGVKDSANWIPGMGGVFDVLDSFLYNGMLFWWLFGIRAFF